MCLLYNDRLLEGLSSFKMKHRISDYQIGWISALSVEETLAIAMLDAKHPRIPTPNDDNAYTFGQINLDDNNAHNIVILCLGLGQTGKASAATAAESMRRTFPSLKFGLMVGIAGGIWSKDNDVRLGDIVVGASEDGEAGVIQYDHGKTVVNQELIKMRGTMNKSPSVLLNAVSSLQAKHDSGDKGYLKYLELDAVQRRAPRPEKDRYFNIGYDHEAPEDKTCQLCDKDELRARPNRIPSQQIIPKIHYGRIASGDQVMKHASVAEKIRRKYGILCFEMEAAGLDAFPSLAIRGISDYADTHKNDEWHPYAAAVAAAYAKELLNTITSTAVSATPAHQQAENAPIPSISHVGNNMDNAAVIYGSPTFGGAVTIGGTHR